MKEQTFKEWMDEVDRDKELYYPTRSNMMHLWFIVRTLQRKVAELEKR